VFVRRAKPLPVGNPTHPATGNKTEQQLIYRGANGFELSLFFNSFDSFPTRFGPSSAITSNWRDSFDRRLRFDGANVVIHRSDGKAIRFVPSAGAWASSADVVEKLVELKFTSGPTAGSTRGWEVTSAKDDEIETYGLDGQLLSIKQRSGRTQALEYSDGTTGANGGVVLDASGNPVVPNVAIPRGLLIRVKDHVGRTIAFGYNSSSQVVKVTNPAGGTYIFTYAASMLSTITFPDKTTRTYLYNESTYTGNVNLPGVLTGIQDEKGNRLSTFYYIGHGRKVTRSENAGSVQRYDFNYGTNTTTVTNPFGAVRTYNFQTVLRVWKNTGITGDFCPECGPASQTPDANGNVSSRTDWRGNIANYGYDLTRNLETSRTEAAGSKQERTITTTWLSNFRLPTGIVEALRTTVLEYDSKGTLTKRKITAITGEIREWTFTPTYSAIDSSQIVKLEENGPRTDLLDKTTYDYYDVNDSVANNRGLLKRVTNALGHFTEITSYNAHGQPLSITDPNGLVTALGYDDRQRLTSRNVGSEITGYEYELTGQLKKVTLPDNSFLLYTYDPAQRLETITDNLGNKIAYTLDAMGNRTLEEIKDPANAVVQKRSREYTILNQLFKDIGGTSPKTQITQYGYDNQGNLTSIDGPLGSDTKTFTYDALNRLATMVDPAGVGGTTTFDYDSLDQIASITDPRSFITSYTYDGLGNLKQQTSPDTGKTANTYDEAGNLKSQTDNKGQKAEYTYDALNRVLSITYPGIGAHNYAYDQGTNQKGLLTQITEPASISTFAYNQKGRLTSETRVTSGVTYPTSYAYDSAGRLNQLGYPSGRQVNYTLDLLGRIGSIATTKNGVTNTVVGSGVAYHPFGGVKTFTFANGQTYSRVYDLDGRVASYNLGSLTQNLIYDEAGRITQIQDQGGGATRTFGYDVLDRLLSSATPGGSQTFTYDPNGNRASFNGSPYAYFTNTNRLQTAGAVSYAYDNNGSATTAGPNTLSYDTRGRLVQATTPTGTATYTINGLGQRIAKQIGTAPTVFHYDRQGRLIAESADAVVWREYVYLYDQPVSVLVTR
jgi:YD repeat-containing protein